MISIEKNVLLNNQLTFIELSDLGKVCWFEDTSKVSRILPHDTHKHHAINFCLKFYLKDTLTTSNLHAAYTHTFMSWRGFFYMWDWIPMTATEWINFTSDRLIFGP